MLDSLEVLVEPLIRNRLDTLYVNFQKAIPTTSSLLLNVTNIFIQQLQDSIPADFQPTMFLLQDVQISLQNAFDLNLLFT